jgi:hypothetical protein
MLFSHRKRSLDSSVEIEMIVTHERAHQTPFSQAGHRFIFYSLESGRLIHKPTIDTVAEAIGLRSKE